MARLLIHGTGHGKKPLRQLPELKILIVQESGGCGNFFSIILIADLQSLEDLFSGSSLSGEILDVGINEGDGSNGSGYCGGDRGFSVPDLLRMVIPLGFSGGLREATFISTVSLFTSSKAKSLSDASSSISRRELLQVDSVNIHGIRILGRM